MPDILDMQVQLILKQHQLALKGCRLCPQMQGPAVHGTAIPSPLMMIGQAPGNREIIIDKPFAWTAGKTLFSWMESIGLDEQQVRQWVYMTAVCRCFPGKAKTGDRVPDKSEINNCSSWLSFEINTIKPQLIVLIGKLSIAQVLSVRKLTDVIGKQYSCEVHGHCCDVIPLPHPSGISTWFRTEPGKTLLANALAKISNHPAWKQLLQQVNF